MRDYTNYGQTNWVAFIVIIAAIIGVIVFVIVGLPIIHQKLASSGQGQFTYLIYGAAAFGIIMLLVRFIPVAKSAMDDFSSNVR
jgi:hypothetical protein